MPFSEVMRTWLGQNLETKSDRSLAASVRYNGMVATNSYSSPKYTDYNSYLRAYKIPWVHAAVRVISFNAANVNYGLYQPLTDPAKPQEEVRTSPLLTLLENPNPTQTGFELRELLWTDLELTGNAFMSLEMLNAALQPAELYRLRPDRVIVIPDPVRRVGGYVYVNGGQRVPYLPHEMIHLKYVNPLDDYYGMGPVEAAEHRMDSEEAMEKHEAEFWKNGAKITGVLSTDQELPDEKWNQLRRSWADFVRGSGYSTAILESGLTYQPVAANIGNMGMDVLADRSRDQILAIFGVPATKIGMLDPNYKATSSDEFFWTETIDPKLTRMEMAMQYLVNVFHPNSDYKLKYDRLNFEDDLPSAQVATAMANTHVYTINEIRAYQGKEPLPEGDVILAPSELVPTDLAGTLATVNEVRARQGETPLPNGDTMIIIPHRAVAFNMATGAAVAAGAPTIANSPPGTPAPATPAPSAPASATGTGGIHNGPQITSAHKQITPTSLRAPGSGVIVARRQKLAISNAEDFLPGIKSVFEGQQSRVRAAVGPWDKKSKSTLEGGDWWDDETEDAELAAALSPLYRQTGLFSLETAARIGLELPLPEAEPSLKEVQAEMLARVHAINQTTKSAILDQVREGLRRSYSVRQILDGVDAEKYRGVAGVFDEARSSRATTIARTEATQTFSRALARISAARGVKEVEIQDGMQDADCASWNGTVIPIEDVDSVMSREHPNGVRRIVPLIPPDFNI